MNCFLNVDGWSEYGGSTTFYHLLAMETNIVGITRSASLKEANNLCTSLKPIVIPTYSTQSGSG